MIKDKPEACYASGCPLANKGRGFVLGTGDPVKAKVAFISELPDNDDVGFFMAPVWNRDFFSTQEQVDAELERRKKAYPNIPIQLLRKGAPMVGKSGVELNMWALPGAGLKRDQIFFDNTIRCLPPRGKTGNYPTGDDRKEAEKCCRMYDRFDQFRPDTALITIHPAGILREVTPLPLQIKDLEKARDFAAQGRRVLVLLGGKAAKAFARFGENVTKFRGAYRLLPGAWVATYKDAFKFQSKEQKKLAKKAKTVASKKMDEMHDLFELAPNTLPKPKFKRKKKEKNVERVEV